METGCPKFSERDSVCSTPLGDAHESVTIHRLCRWSLNAGDIMNRLSKDDYGIGLVLFLVAVVLTCCSAPSETIVVEKKNVTVKLVEHLKEPGYDHPGNLSAEEVVKVLGSLFFSRYELFHWGDEEPVFEQGTIDRCAAPIAEAFRRASAVERVRFSVVERFKQLIFAHDVTTTAEAFRKGDELHIIFLQLKDEFMPDGAGRTDGSSYSPGRDWKLVSGPAQRLESGKRSFSDGRGSSKNWIVIDLHQIDRLEGRRESAVEQVQDDEGAVEEREEAGPGEAGVEEGALTDEIIEKLRALKVMREEGLITEEEYQRKKVELLDKM